MEILPLAILFVGQVVKVLVHDGRAGGEILRCHPGKDKVIGIFRQPPKPLTRGAVKNEGQY